MNYENRMTAEQKGLVLFTKADALHHVTKCANMARQCFAAIVSLPHTNENGEAVVHGCNNIMQAAAERWLESGRPLLAYLDRDTIDDIERVHGVSFSRLRPIENKA